MPYWRLYYHIGWTTKARHCWLTGDRAELVEACLRKKVHEFGGLVHAVAVRPDHVHLAVSLPPAQALSKMIGDPKGGSSFLLRRRHPSVIQEGFDWQPEYGVVSFNERILPQVIAYIANQEERHRQDVLWDLLERDEPGT